MYRTGCFRHRDANSMEAVGVRSHRIGWEAGEAVARWAGAGSGGAGSARLREPDCFLVVGNCGGGREIPSVCDQWRLPERGRYA